MDVLELITLYNKVKKGKMKGYNELIAFVDKLDVNTIVSNNENYDVDKKDIETYITEYIGMLRNRYDSNNNKIFELMDERDEIQKKINHMCAIYENNNKICKETAEK